MKSGQSQAGNLILHLGVEAAMFEFRAYKGTCGAKATCKSDAENDSIRKRNERVNETADAEYKTLLHELERLKEEANILHWGGGCCNQNSEHAPGRKTRRMLQMRKSIGDRDMGDSRRNSFERSGQSRAREILFALGVEAAAVRIKSIQRGRSRHKSSSRR